MCNKNPSTRVILVAHVDDFLIHGEKVRLFRLLGDMKEMYPCGGEILGPGEYEVLQLKYLGRRVSYTVEGIEWEGYDNHTKAFNREVLPHGGNIADTPGLNAVKETEATRT